MLHHANKAIWIKLKTERQRELDWEEFIENNATTES